MLQVTSNSIIDKFINNVVSLYQAYDFYEFQDVYDTEEEAFDELREGFENQDLFDTFVGLGEIEISSCDPELIADAIVAKIVLNLYEEEFRVERGGDAHGIITKY